MPAIFATKLPGEQLDDRGTPDFLAFMVPAPGTVNLKVGQAHRPEALALCRRMGRRREH